MTELTSEQRGARWSQIKQVWRKTDKAWAAVLLLPLLLVLVDPPQAAPVITIALGAFAGTLPIILFAITAVAYVKASGAETLIARAFEGDPRLMIVMAALMGGLSPFCSCEVIPFIAALLALGAPLAAVMAFWLASPLMDPAMFFVTAGELGLTFALGKTAAAIGLGIFGGTATHLFAGSAVFANPLREKPQIGGCCGVKQPFQGQPHWRFWTDAERRIRFRDSWVENALFLGKWLLLAYLFEGAMIAYNTTPYVAQFLNGDGIGTIIAAALIGMPAYLNGYMAVGLMGGLVDQGMAEGAAMAFILAGGVSSIPAAVAVWALVKPRVFTAYLGFALTGAIIAGLTWGLIA